MGKKFSGDIVAWRCRFLWEIVLSNKEEIVQIDETCVNAGHSKSETWTDDTTRGTMKTPIWKANRLILLHTGASNGFVPGAMLLFASKKTGDYHKEMTADRFLNWFETALLPNLTNKSVIVIDNAPNHCMQSNNAPTTASRKNDISEWLQKNKIPGVQENMKKAELVELVKIHNPRFVSYILKLAAARGHKVLRLPPYCHFSAIEEVQARIKEYVADNSKTFN